MSIISCNKLWKFCEWKFVLKFLESLMGKAWYFWFQSWIGFSKCKLSRVVFARASLITMLRRGELLMLKENTSSIKRSICNLFDVIASPESKQNMLALWPQNLCKIQFFRDIQNQYTSIYFYNNIFNYMCEVKYCRRSFERLGCMYTRAEKIIRGNHIF